jgi:hypothetical protein
MSPRFEAVIPNAARETASRFRRGGFARYRGFTRRQTETSQRYRGESSWPSVCRSSS